MKQTRAWYVSYRLPESKGLGIGPIVGSRETAQRIRRLLEKVNDQIIAGVVDSANFSETPREAAGFLQEIVFSYQNGIEKIKIVIESDNSLVGVCRQEMRRFQEILREAEDISRALPLPSK